MQTTNSLGKNEQYKLFEHLLGQKEIAIRSFVRSLLRDSQDLDDLMQEIGLVCWKKFDSFNQEEDSNSFLRWACVVARFEVLRHRRNKARDRLVLSEEVVSLLAEDAELRLERAENERIALEACIAHLTANDRRLLLSVHTAGDSIASIAEEYGEKARRLYSKLNSLRKVLAKCVLRKVGEAGN